MLISIREKGLGGHRASLYVVSKAADFRSSHCDSYDLDAVSLDVWFLIAALIS